MHSLLVRFNLKIILVPSYVADNFSFSHFFLLLFSQGKAFKSHSVCSCKEKSLQLKVKFEGQDLVFLAIMREFEYF